METKMKKPILILFIFNSFIMHAQENEIIEGKFINSVPVMQGTLYVGSSLF